VLFYYEGYVLENMIHMKYSNLFNIVVAQLIATYMCCLNQILKRK